MNRTRVLIVALALLLLAAGSAGAQATQTRAGDTAAAVDASASLQVRPDSAAVVLRGDTLFMVFGRLGPFSAAERASAITSRIRALRVDGAEPDSVRVVDDGGHSEVWVGSVTVLTVTAADTAARESTRAATANLMAEGVRKGLSTSFLTRGVREILWGLLWTLISTAVLYGLLRLMSHWYPRLYRRIRSVQEDKLPVLKFQNLVLLTGERIEATILLAARASRLIFTALLIFLYLPIVFSFFPPTRVVAQRIVALTLEPARSAWWGVIGYLPNLFYIAVISLLVYYGLRLVRMVFSAIGSGTIRIPGFYPDWADPTFKLVRVLVLAFAVILVWPFLPNSNSLAFKGVAGFLGLLLTFGSAGAVSNVVGGVVMIYMRPFQIGDRVKIADTVGDVMQRGMLVTRLRTPKNVEITIPNSMVLGNFIVNYSATARAGGVILHTTVTIGYDTPWPRVHEALKEAARRTPGVLRPPEPFVLQTALGDYAVSYELNAHTEEPQHIPKTYSDLHQNIQEVFAESGMEILSPLYHAVRDGNPTTIPDLERSAGSSSQAEETSRS